jgi:hypothetical protein
MFLTCARVARLVTLAVVLAISFVPPSVATLLCMVLLPFVYYWVMRPEVTAMPDASAAR